MLLRMTREQAQRALRATVIVLWAITFPLDVVRSSIADLIVDVARHVAATANSFHRIHEHMVP